MADVDVQCILAEAADAEAVADDVLGRPEILDESGDVLAAENADMPLPARAGPKQKARAARKIRPHELCPGQLGHACCFSLRETALGQPAVLPKGDKTCMWCSPERLQKVLAEPQRRKHVTHALRVWTDADQAAVLTKAWERLPASHHGALRAALARPSRAKAAVSARKAAAVERQSWHALLNHRVNLGLPMSPNAEAVYLAKKADDDRRLRAKFGAVMQARDAGDRNWRSPTAERFEQWCRTSSWLLCEQCLRLEQRRVQQRDISGTGPRKNTVRKCHHCQSGAGYPTVSANMIPEELQNISLDVLWALRPLEPDVGLPVFAKHGYRVHTDMIRFWWRPQTVQEQIQSLEDDQHRAAAQAAYRYLVNSADSSYGYFVQMHERFLRRHCASLTGEPDDPLLRLPRRALEEEGLECAVWPHLYPRTSMCETYIRRADVRRRDRHDLQPASRLVAGSASEDDGASDSDQNDAGNRDEEDACEDDAEAAAPLDFAKPNTGRLGTLP